MTKHGIERSGADEFTLASDLPAPEIARKLAQPGAGQKQGELAGAVTVVSAYRFYMFALARELNQHGALRHLVTAMPRRSVSEVPANVVQSRPWLALLRHASSRARLGLETPLIRLVLADFDRWAATKLSGEPIVHALSASATGTLAKAAAAGSRIVCDRGSWHILEQRRVLEEEAGRWGWGATSIDPWIVERELRDYEAADTIFVPSEPALRSFVRRGVAADRVAKVSFGADLHMFTPDPRGRDAQRIICVGPLGLRKGHQYLLPAYRQVRREGSSLVLLGAASREAVRRLGLPETDVVIAGAVSRDRVAVEMRRSGIFALASVEEGLALVIAQAMASGLPIVATEATGAEDLVTDGVEGFIVPSSDTDAFASALERLLSDPELAAAMGVAGRNRIESHGGWRRYGEMAVQIYDSLVG